MNSLESLTPLPESYKCPRCKLNTATSINFGKRAICHNCKYVWKIVWRGGGKFSNHIRNELK